MDEFTAMTLLAEGESNRIDFKRQLDLTSADGKAEFVKDVIALANSASNVGCLLIGVDDTRYITGIARLEEEQIQQIAYTYITPAVTINCSLVPISNPTTLLVGLADLGMAFSFCSEQRSFSRNIVGSFSESRSYQDSQERG